MGIYIPVRIFQDFQYCRCNPNNQRIPITILSSLKEAYIQIINKKNILPQQCTRIDRRAQRYIHALRSSISSFVGQNFIKFST